MIWQDTIFTIGGIVFAVGLIPQLRDCLEGYTLNLWTAATTTIVLSVYCVTYASLGLWLSAVPCTATVWALIFLVSWRNSRRAGGD